MSALERHYSTKEIAELWQLSDDTVRKIFGDHPEVVKIGSTERLHKRGYITLRVPESVVQKIHAELRRRSK